jgi:hypothetical protein
MRTLKRPHESYSSMRRRQCDGSRRRRFSPFMLLGLLASALFIIGAGAYIVLQPSHSSDAAEDAVNCTLIVPAHPLTAQGLATPYQLTATDPNMGPCRESNLAQAAFVQGAIFDPATGQISMYEPLVINQGQRPAIAPIVPKLPQNAIVALWFGFNGQILTLQGSQQNLQNNNCVNGLNGSPFGEVAYCNAPAFFTAANNAIQSGLLKPPALGTASDGQACPSVRDFFVVDQDQSDNVTASYLVDGRGRMAQDTDANMAQLAGANLVSNASDNGLLDINIDGALGCHPWMVPDLSNPGHMTAAQPTNEIQAAMYQQNPVALVPAGDPMVLVNDNANLNKLTLYRQGVDQPVTNSLADASTTTYCQNIATVAPTRLFADQSTLSAAASPMPDMATNLFTFLAQRLNMTWTNLNCQDLTGMHSPVQVMMQGDVAVGATRWTGQQQHQQQGNQHQQRQQNNQGQQSQQNGQGQSDSQNQYWRQNQQGWRNRSGSTGYITPPQP